MFGSMADQVDEQQLGRVEALIHSMTPGERSKPDIIDKSRMSRIARGSGRRSKDVRDLLERFKQMRTMMAELGSGDGMLSKIPGFNRLAGVGGMDPTALLAGGPGAKKGKLRREASGARTHQKSKRKQARKARRKNRRH
jgi:signal recognition particle subunit SRP54